MELDDAALMGAMETLSPILNRQQMQATAVTIASLLKARCPIHMTSIPAAKMLLSHSSAPAVPYVTSSVSGNLSGSAPQVEVCIDRGFDRMDYRQGSKRSSYDTTTFMGQRAQKRVRNETGQNAAGTTETVADNRADWTTDMVSILEDVMASYLPTLSSSTSNIRWKAVLTMWKTRSAVTVTREQLKAKWQRMQVTVSRRPVQDNTSSIGDSASAQHFPLQFAASSSHYLPVSASSSQHRPVAASSNQHRPLAASSSPPLHPLASENYELSRIGQVTLQEAPSGAQFSPIEIEVFTYILLTKLKYQAGGKIKWKKFASYWPMTARVAKLNDPEASVFLRTKNQIEEKWKTTMKKLLNPSAIEE